MAEYSLKTSNETTAGFTATVTWPDASTYQVEFWLGWINNQGIAEEDILDTINVYNSEGINGGTYTYTYAGELTANTEYSLEVVFVGYDGTEVESVNKGFYVTEVVDPEPTIEWGISSGDVPINTNKEWTRNITKQYTLLYRKFTFNVGGKVVFYATSTDIDPVGYLSVSNSYDETTGIPSNVKAQGDDGYGDNGNGFEFLWTVDTGDVYYFWVRDYTGTNTGSVTFGVRYIIDDDLPACTLNCTVVDRVITDDYGNILTCYNYPVITSEEFNQFCKDINAVRLKAGTYEVAFAEQAPGTPMTAQIWNDIIGAVYTIKSNYFYENDLVTRNKKITLDFIEFVSQMVQDLQGFRDDVYK